MSNNLYTEKNEQQIEETASVYLGLEVLTIKYNNLLNQYNQAVVNYINYLQQEQLDSSNNQLSIIPNQAFWGTGPASSAGGQTNSPNSCMALCSSTQGCSGATYNPNTQMCFLRTGENTPVPNQNTYAIIPTVQVLLNNINSINQELSSVNEQILSIVNNSKTLYEQQYEERSIQNNVLKNNFKDLQKERNKIEKMISEYQDLEQQQTNSSIKISQNYFVYILLLFLAIAFMFILSKLSLFKAVAQPVSQITSTTSSQLNEGQSHTSKWYFIFYAIVIIVCIATITYNYNYIVNETSNTTSSISSSLHSFFHV